MKRRFSLRSAFLYGAASAIGLSAPAIAYAHCPLCTVGAGALAVLAASLGVNSISIGVFIGAAGLALGLWAARYVKKQYVWGQRSLIGIASFVLTVIPLVPLFRDYTSWYLALAGEYGSLLHRTYLINRFVLGALLGAALLAVAPSVSALLTKVHGRRVPYQGMAVVAVFLLGAALLIEFGL
ncbi:MAG: hypothetical protein AAB633_01735 [Patescibacteria group bacterium]